jgi:hypothetical protein
VHRRFQWWWLLFNKNSFTYFLLYSITIVSARWNSTFIHANFLFSYLIYTLLSALQLLPGCCGSGPGDWTEKWMCMLAVSHHPCPFQIFLIDCGILLEWCRAGILLEWCRAGILFSFRNVHYCSSHPTLAILFCSDCTIVSDDVSSSLYTVCWVAASPISWFGQ